MSEANQDQASESFLKRQVTVINLMGGPNTGKTTVALGLSYFMKRQGLRVKYTQEYAEDMVYENRFNILTDQLYVLAKQNRRLLRLLGHTDFIITDSPLVLCKVYSKEGGTPEFRALVDSIYGSYKNITFYLPRNEAFPFQTQGRVQESHLHAREVDSIIEQNLPPETIFLKKARDYVAQITEHMNLPIDLTGPR